MVKVVPPPVPPLWTFTPDTVGVSDDLYVNVFDAVKSFWVTTTGQAASEFEGVY
jgi:hypothetical protein